MKKVLVVLLVLVIGFVAFVATRPAKFRVERSATVEAPPEVVYAQIEDFHRWDTWSPWEHLDPDMKREFEGSPEGVGAAYHWSGNDKVGEGRMTISELRPPEQIVIQLDFLKPFEAKNVTTFTLSPVAAGTQVTWSMEGENNFMAKAMGVFMNMDTMIGGDFEKGLASLDSVATVAADQAIPDTAAATMSDI